VSKKEKLEAKIRNNPRNVSLEDFESLIWQYGEIKEGGSHPQAIIGTEVISYKRTNPMRAPYVSLVLDLVDKVVKKNIRPD
jgi:hypothetical protein